VNTTIHIALVQSNLVWENPIENFKKFDELLNNINQETDIIILPEVFSTGFTMNLKNLETPIGKSAFDWLKKKAEKLNKTLIGSFIFEDNNNYYNRMFWMLPDGNFSYYDKRHLFQMGNEHKVIKAGDKRVIIPYKGVNFMLQICYDLRFPVWVKNRYDANTKKHDYDVLLYIANWPEVRRDAYLSLLKARAIENQSYVIWVNRIGKDDKEINHTGDSQVVDPFGNVLVQMQKNKEGLLYTSIDLDRLNTFRKSYKVGLDWDKFTL
jgi:predicted amidohydrolase